METEKNALPATEAESKTTEIAGQKPVIQKKVAILKHPLIEAAISGLFRFKEQKQAVKRLREINEKFIVAKDQEENLKQNKLRLWIKDYAILPEEVEKGYRGHFAEISVIEIEPGKFSLKTEKIEVPVNSHPQRTRPKGSHPDWGHPVMRRLEKKPLFNTLEEANAVLMRLHEEYPNISIPGDNQLLIMIYRRKKDAVEKGGMPVQKYKFQVVVGEAGGFRILFNEHIPGNRKFDRAAIQVQESGEHHHEEDVEAYEEEYVEYELVEEEHEEDSEEKSSSYFTSMAALKKKKRK